LGKSLDPPAELPIRPQELGLQLRLAREACRLSIASAAASLHLSPRVIEALEGDEFGRFEPVYVRGYLRNYARLLNLPADPLIESYNRTQVPDHLPAQPQSESAQAKKSALSLFLPLAVVSLPLVLWAASKAFQAFEDTGPPMAKADLAVPAQSGEASPSAPLPGQTASLAGPKPPEPGGTGTEPTAQPTPKEPPATNPPAPASHPPEAATGIPPPPASPAPPSEPAGLGPDSIAIHLSASGWVAIHDQTGRRLVYENLPAGTDRAYAGRAPFTMVLGNSPATKIELNGQPFAQPKGKAGTVARFTVSQ